MMAGWRRHRWSGKKTLVTVLGGLLVVEAVNVELILLGLDRVRRAARRALAG